MHGRFSPIRTGDILLDAALEQWRVVLEVLSGSTWDGGSGVSSHDHSSLVALGGRPGGQTVCGGTAPGQDLVLQSTSDPSRGIVSVVDDMALQGRLRLRAMGPKLIEEDQNDYPCGGRGALLLKTDASRTVTGLAGGKAGQVLLLVNVGAFDLVLAHDNNGSTDVNRIILTLSGANLTVPPNGSVTLWYDADLPRWRAIGMHV